MQQNYASAADATTDEWLHSRQPFDRSNWEQWRQLAWEAMDGKRIAAAIYCFREVTRLKPAAVQFYREGCAREPSNWAARMALIRALRAAGERATAVDECRAILAYGYEDKAFFAQVGNQLQALDQYDEAIQSSRPMRAGRFHSPRSNLCWHVKMSSLSACRKDHKRARLGKLSAAAWLVSAMNWMPPAGRFSTRRQSCSHSSL